MLAKHAAALLGLLLLASVQAAPCYGAEPATQAGITIEGGSAASTVLTADDIAQLSAVQVSVAFGTEHGPRQATFEGPLLWTVLDHAKAVGVGKAGEQVRQVVLLTGRDGYMAVLGLGEISPDFEGKQVILAERMDGKPLAPDHLRVVVPGDRKGGRSVRDLVRIVVAPLQPPQH